MMFDEVHSVRKALSAIGSLPENIDALSFCPAPIPAADTERLTQARKYISTSTGASCPIPSSGFITIASDLLKVENRPAKAAHPILQGIDPAGLPVETTDFFLTLSLKTAQAIGLTVQEDLEDRLIRSPAGHPPLQQSLKAIAAFRVWAAWKGRYDGS
jgi:hypothetical protein